MPTLIIGTPNGTEVETAYSSSDLARRVLPPGYWVKEEVASSAKQEGSPGTQQVSTGDGDLEGHTVEDILHGMK